MNRNIVLLTLFLSFGFHSGSPSTEENSGTKGKVQEPLTKFSDRPFLEGLGMSIQLQDNWTYEKNENAFIFKENCTDVFCSNMVVRLMENESDLGMAELTQAFITSISQRFREIKVLGVTEEKIGDLNFTIADYKMHEGSTHLGGTTALTIKGAKIVSFNFMGENQQAGSYVNHRKVFFQMLNSLKS